MACIARLTSYCFPEINWIGKELKKTTRSFASHKILFTEDETFHSKISPSDHDYIDYLRSEMDWFDNINKIRNDIIHFLEGKIFPYPSNEYEIFLERKYKNSEAILSEIKEYSTSLFNFLYFFDKHFFEKLKYREELRNIPELRLVSLGIDFKNVRYEDLIYRINPVHVRVKQILKEFLFA